MTSKNSSPNRVDAVLLDVDGTLIDSAYHHALAWSRSFTDEGLWCPVWRTHRAIGMGGDHLVAYLFDEDTEERLGDALRDGWQRHYEEVMDEVRALPGARDLVLDLKARGIKVALASSSPQEFTEKALEMMDLTEDDFDAVTTSADAEKAKPSPDILQVALEELGAERAVMVGDATWDVVAAQKIGLPTVTVLSGGFGADELSGAGAAAVVDGVADLVGFDWDSLPRP